MKSYYTTGFEKETDEFKFNKVGFEINVSSDWYTLSVQATHPKEDYRLKGQYTFDSLPEILRVYESLSNVCKYIRLQKDTNYISLTHQGLEIQFSITGLLTKRTILPLQKYQLTQNQKLRRAYKVLKSQIAELQIKQKQSQQVIIQKDTAINSLRTEKSLQEQEIKRQKDVELSLTKSVESLRKQLTAMNSLINEKSLQDQAIKRNKDVELSLTKQVDNLKKQLTLVKNMNEQQLQQKKKMQIILSKESQNLKKQLQQIQKINVKLMVQNLQYEEETNSDTGHIEVIEDYKQKVKKTSQMIEHLEYQLQKQQKFHKKRFLNVSISFGMMLVFLLCISLSGGF